MATPFNMLRFLTMERIDYRIFWGYIEMDDICE